MNLEAVERYLNSFGKQVVNRSKGNLQKAKGGTEELTKAVEDSTKKATEFEIIWENTIRDLDSGFRDLWRGFVDGSVDALDMVKGIAYDFLAEMLHAFTTKKIVASFGAMFGASGTASANPMTSSMGQMNPSSMTNMFNAGSTFFDSMALSGASTAAWAPPAHR